MRRFDLSVPLFEELYKARTKKHGADHEKTIHAGANLGTSYKDAGKLKEAIPLLEKAHRAVKENPELRWASGQLIDAYKRAGQNAKAATALLEYRAALRKVVPKNSPQLGGVLAQVGLELLGLKKWAEAEPLARECLAIREKHMPDHWMTFNSRAQLGAALLGQKRYKDAEPLL